MSIHLQKGNFLDTAILRIGGISTAKQQGLASVQGQQNVAVAWVNYCVFGKMRIDSSLVYISMSVTADKMLN